MPSSTSHHAWHDPGRTARLLIGILTGPLAWAAVLQANYVLSYVACEQRSTWFLHAIAIAASALVGIAGWLAWRAGPPASGGNGQPPVTPQTSESRARWMSLSGVVMSAWFIAVILAMEIPVLVLRTCQ
jgi:hypothetical protein